MISALYIEEAVRDHPRAQLLQSRFPKVPHIICQRYGEIFNRRGQDFRLQKKRPALILANKHERRILPTPPGYGIGGCANYYFSHILNCLYDCRYCFLQGLYQSAHYVFFLNYEDFQAEMDAAIAQHPAEEAIYFFSGYDGDSFALESLTEFVAEHLGFFRERPRAILELRTKSLRARDLLNHAPQENVIAAFSLTPEPISKAYELGVPPLENRLNLMKQLAEAGWPIGLRLDPVIHHQGFEEHYQQLLEEIFRRLTPDQVHSVSLGLMRFPKSMHKQIARLYPEEPLFAVGLSDEDRLTEESPHQTRPLEWLADRLGEYVSEERLFVCH